MTKSRREEGLPENWRERIAGKKVVFYNTSIVTLLMGKEEHLKKMRWVFELFQKETDVVLWWRPHPLEEATVQAKLPQIYSMYSELKLSFQQDNTGILDESADMYRAIAVSDAYYGDWSSLLHLYRETGKPILVGTAGVNVKSFEKVFMVTDFAVYGNTLWFLSQIYNSLFALDLNTMEIAKIIRIPCLLPFSTHTMLSIFCQKDEIVLIPNKVDHIITYNIKQEKILKSPKGTRDFHRFSRICTKRGDYLYAVSRIEHFVYKYCISEDTYQKIPVGDSENKYIGIKWVDEIFVLIQSSKDEVVLWDEETEEIEVIKEFPEKYVVWNRENCFADMVVTEHAVLIFPQYSNMILKLEINNKRITQYFNSFDDYSFDQGSLFTCAKVVGDKIYAYAHYKNRWMIYDDKEGICKQSEMKVKDELYKELLIPSFFETIKEDDGNEETSYFYEMEDRYNFTVKKYIDNIKVYVGNLRKARMETKENYGTEIYKKLIPESDMQ